MQTLQADLDYELIHVANAMYLERFSRLDLCKIAGRLLLLLSFLASIDGRKETKQQPPLR